MEYAKVIEHLNRALSIEYSAVIQYCQHSALIEGSDRMLYEEFFDDASKEARDHAKKVSDWIVSLGGVPTIEAAHAALPACGYGEYEGVFVSFAGRVQRARQAVRPRGLADPPWLILRELGRRFGLSEAYPSASVVFDEVVSQVPAFAGLSYRALGETGRQITGA